MRAPKTTSMILSALVAVAGLGLTACKDSGGGSKKCSAGNAGRVLILAGHDEAPVDGGTNRQDFAPLEPKRGRNSAQPRKKKAEPETPDSAIGFDDLSRLRVADRLSGHGRNGHVPPGNLVA